VDKLARQFEDPQAVFIGCALGTVVAITLILLGFS
jgi:hypothetical protein